MKLKKYGGVSKLYLCPICHKSFLVPFQTKGGGKTHWVYCLYKERRKIYLCSYHCFLEAKERLEA